mgnify:FL=1
MQYRNLPNVNSVLDQDCLQLALSKYKREWMVDLVRRGIEDARESITNGNDCPTVSQIAGGVQDRLEVLLSQSPKRLINATGVIIHTNLGRSPLSSLAIDAAQEASAGYSDLELDVVSGKRGSRQAHLQSLLQEITGAEAALVVNNNASALLLGLSALAHGKEVVVSRGEAIEIGGGFRIPEVMSQSGARLIDVGTTNRTYVRDYENALTGDTGLFLKAHSSNFKVEGFTADVDPIDLVALGRANNIPVIHDVGSGALMDTSKYGLAHEPTPQESIKAGVGLVMFSGDKLLGGPQAGIIIGTKSLIEILARHPLARAMRIDKMSLASLTATLTHYLKDEAESEIPIWKMISEQGTAIKRRASKWRKGLESITKVVPSKSAVGGGSLPGETLPSWCLSIDCSSILGGTEGLMQRLRNNITPVIARIEDDMVLLDPRTVLKEEDMLLMTALNKALED